jgi:hypothetical protein
MGKAIVIAMWESEADMEIAGLITGPPVKQSYEVTVQA